MIEEKLSTCLKSVVIYRIWPFESTIETSAFGTERSGRQRLHFERRASGRCYKQKSDDTIREADSIGRRKPKADGTAVCGPVWNGGSNPASYSIATSICTKIYC